MEKQTWTGKTRALAAGCAAVLLLGGFLSGMGLRKLFPDRGECVSVYSVEGLRNKKWSDAIRVPATVEAGSLTAYYYDSRKPAVELYVKEGQMVEAGTPLLRYDCTRLEEELSGVEQTLRNQRIYLERLGSFIGTLRATKPRREGLGLGKAGGSRSPAVSFAKVRTGEKSFLSFVGNRTGEKVPVISAEESLEGLVEEERPGNAPVVYERVDKTSVPSGGNGTAQDPYVYYIRKGGEVAPEVTAILVRLGRCGRFVIVEDEGSIQAPLLVWTFDGKVYEEIIQEEPPSESDDSSESKDESSSPEESSASTTESESTEPSVETSEKETSSSQSEASTPESSTPVTDEMETSASETEGPETSISETSRPETEIPETSISETSRPETEIPETSISETRRPETEIPETSIPEESTLPSEETPSAPNSETAPADSFENFDDEALDGALGGLENAPQGYTKEELAQAIRERSLEYKNLELSIREAELQTKTLQAEIEEGVLTAKADGQVRIAMEPAEAAHSGQPILVLQGRTGNSLKGQMNEMLAASLKPGDKFSVSARVREKEVSFEAVLQSIEKDPETGNGTNDASGRETIGSVASGGTENPAMSYYCFSASLTDAKGIGAGDVMEVMIPRTLFEQTTGEAPAGGGLVLPDALLFYENGSAFVYAMDGNNRLEKRPVKIGRSFEGTNTEILEGITEKDYLAYPKEAAGLEGASVRLVYGTEMEIRTEASGE
ncbi:MAG: hypothetical protein HFI63_10825 [Lachnospiraceae bacterium]|nr:hypothetical protein [Lachnospiraceae bacterium]